MDFLVLAAEAHEAHEEESLLVEFWEVFTDPAHVLAEVSSALVIDGIIIAVLYPLLIKPLWARFKTNLVKDVHRDIDKAHGIEHPHE